MCSKEINEREMKRDAPNLLWSIRLGFKGEINDALFEKIKSVKKVRFKLKYELFGYTVFSIAFLYMVIISTNLTTKIATGILSLVLAYASIKHLRVWHEIFTIQKERMEEYVRKNKTSHKDR